ncbi:MAG: arylamine N-acetyltransferase [Fimbriimonadaceae bacterium]|nr:arylamine N-acetyltransferase [Fimbriimonadaceae bacterium]
MPSSSATPLAFILNKLGFHTRPEKDFEGLQELYRAWCLHVPADNILKLIALRTGNPGPLPGNTANEFFENWLEHNTGGTCWSATNACYELFKGAGFDARRATASVWDMGTDNHGTVIVKLDGVQWLLDSSMHTLVPLPLNRGEEHIQSDPVYHSEVDPDGNSFYIWSVAPPLPQMIVFKMLEWAVPEEVYHANYERSREQSIFNDRLYIRRNEPDRMIVFSGNHKFELTAGGLEERKLTESELLAELKGPLGYSTSVIDSFVSCGALEASMKPREGLPNIPEIARVPPSQRKN